MEALAYKNPKGRYLLILAASSWRDLGKRKLEPSGKVVNKRHSSQQQIMAGSLGVFAPPRTSPHRPQPYFRPPITPFTAHQSQLNTPRYLQEHA